MSSGFGRRPLRWAGAPSGPYTGKAEAGFPAQTKCRSGAKEGRAFLTATIGPRPRRGMARGPLEVRALPPDREAEPMCEFSFSSPPVSGARCSGSACALREPAPWCGNRGTGLRRVLARHRRVRGRPGAPHRAGLRSMGRRCLPDCRRDLRRHGPVVALTAPPPGATIRNSTTITATASDANGVASVAFQVDGALLWHEHGSAVRRRVGAGAQARIPRAHRGRDRRAKQYGDERGCHRGREVAAGKFAPDTAQGEAPRSASRAPCWLPSSSGGHGRPGAGDLAHRRPGAELRRSCPAFGPGPPRPGEDSRRSRR
jgi:Big-like domain-containing protein